MQKIFHAQQLVDLALDEFGDGNARPARDHLGNVFGVNFFFQERAVRLELVEFARGGVDRAFELGQGAIAQGGRAREVALALEALRLGATILVLLLGDLDLGDRLLLCLPARGQLVGLFL